MTCADDPWNTVSRAIAKASPAENWDRGKGEVGCALDISGTERHGGAVITRTVDCGNRR